QFLVVGPGAQGAAQVGLLGGEQAVADLPVGGEPDPVTGGAEGAGDRADDADPGRSAVDEEQFGGGAATLGRVVGGEVDVAGQQLQDLVGGDHVLAPPAVLGVQRHLLDETQLV